MSFFTAPSYDEAARDSRQDLWKIFALPSLAGYHGFMTGAEAMTTYIRDSSGAQSAIWTFGSRSEPVRPACGILELTSPEAASFDWLVPWWNADIAGDAAMELFLAVETQGSWSRWYPMGRWSKVPSTFACADAAAKVETDTLVLEAKASRYKLKVEVSPGAGGTGSVVIRRLGVLARERGLARSRASLELLAESAIAAPCRSQMVEAEEIRGRICSPTCGAMALQSLGLDYPTAFVAADCYDAGAKIYGNWAFNVASLWRLGARARLGFFPSIEAASALLKAGSLIIASIRFGEGKLSGAPIGKTNGHLVLLTGLKKDESGAWRVLVNDPAAANPAGVRRDYDLEEFERAWTGVGYIIEDRVGS